jgi:hypothetical protein
LLRAISAALCKAAKITNPEKHAAHNILGAEARI